MTRSHRNAAEAATAMLGEGLSARVLEPSPPTVNDGPFLADDPVARGDASGLVIVSPVSSGDTTWDEIVHDRPELAAFARANWLGARGPLPALPRDYPAARNAFHRLAYAVVAEARRRANSKFGLRFTSRGFGTPFFGNDEQVRVMGGLVVHQTADDVREIPITTLAEVAAALGIEPGTDAAEHDSPPLGDIDEPLAITTETGIFLGEWFGFSWAVLEELRLTPGAIDPERPQLWPGHFDPALAIGDPENGRATYGCSPGDHDHDEPYLYVGAWGDVDRDDPYWNETTFNGASLPFAALADTEDPYTVALDFFRNGYQKLNDMTGA